jgi:hypothetical protein
MEKELKFSIDGVQYVMTPANSMAAWTSLKRAASIFKGVDIEEVKKGDGQEGRTSMAIGTLISNLGDPAIAEIEALVFASTAVQDTGKSAYRLSDDLDGHFNQHRAHLLEVLVRGVKYQYTDFFTGGMKLAGLIPALYSYRAIKQTGSSGPP